MFTRTKSDQEDLPWVEKYRPHSLSEVMGHEWIIKSMKNFVEKRKIPHMIFTGPAGTGKTSTAIGFIRDILGDDFSSDQIMELNASDNVRMDTVRAEIKNFTNSMSFFSSGNAFKFIILDEADNIPKAPQQALRRIMEKSPANIRFIFMCNYENRIIDPIKSRCALFRFTILPKPIVLKRLKYIEKEENLKLSDKFNELLFFVSGGDLRQAVNLLQLSANLGITDSEDYNKLYEIAGFIPHQSIVEIYNGLKEHDYKKIKALIERNKGISPRKFLIQMINQIIDSAGDISNDETKLSLILEALAEYDYRITMGADEYLQIESALWYLMEII